MASMRPSETMETSSRRVKPVRDPRVLRTWMDSSLEVHRRSGNFREDLFFRLNVVTIQLPPLNERKEDIPLLVKHFIKKYSLAFHKPVVDIQSQALQLLINYSYPGNVRELENIIERAVALTDSEHIRVPDLPEDLQQLELDIIQGEGLLSLEEIEKRHIARVLEKTGYNKSLTAQILNVPRTTLWRKMKEYKLQ
jgi:two-component system, NtrC family, response regulator AtoC